MGLIYADITLSNPRLGLDMPVRALVDSGALLLYIPPHIALQLQLTELEKREVTLADGGRQLIPYVGPIEVRSACSTLLCWNQCSISLEPVHAQTLAVA